MRGRDGCALERWGSNDLDAAVLLGALRESGKVHEARRSFEGLAGAAVEGFAFAGRDVAGLAPAEVSALQQWMVDALVKRALETPPPT